MVSEREILIVICELYLSFLPLVPINIDFHEVIILAATD